MSEDFVPTAAADYPVVRESQLELPSGAKVIVRPPSVFVMLRRGQVPADVRGIIERIESKQDVTEEEMFTVLDCLVAASFVSPKVSTKRKKGSVFVDDLPDDDRLAVIKALNLRKVI